MQTSAVLSVPQDPFPGQYKLATDFSRYWFLNDIFHPLFEKVKSNFTHLLSWWKESIYRIQKDVTGRCFLLGPFP